MEQTPGEHTCAKELTDYHFSKGKGYSFDLNQIDKSFALLYFHFSLMFERNESCWTIIGLQRFIEIP